MKETKFKQTEVGMIPSDWELKKIGELCSITTGSQNTQDHKEDGKYPFFVRSQEVERIDKYIFDTEGVVTAGDGVGTGKIFHYVNGKFGLHQRCYLMYEFDRNISAKYFYWIFSVNFYDRVHSMTAKSSVDSVRREMIADMPIALPPIKEQQRIANALSDVDALINNLEKLIAKKKNIKQGAMQQLLTGKKRLPGFGSDERTGSRPTDERRKECHSERSAKREVEESSGYKMTELGLIPTDWEVKNVGKLLKIGHGRDYKNLKSGNVPVYGTGGYMTSVNDYLYEGVTVCIGRKGTIDKPFYHTGKIWTVDTLFYTYGFNGCIPKFIYYAFCLVDWLAMNEASGVPSLTSKNIEDVLLRIPPSKAEQTAIANVLSDMDTEIAVLETKLTKYRTLKTGMMQQLLTGKIRLV